MQSDLQIDVAALDDQHRRALEEVIGQHLRSNQRLVINVSEIELPPNDQARPAQSLDEWTRVYEGLSDAEIESIDTIANTRANLTRDLP